MIYAVIHFSYILLFEIIINLYYIMCAKMNRLVIWQSKRKYPNGSTQPEVLKPEVLAVNPLDMEVVASICARFAAFWQHGQRANNFAKPFLNDLKNGKKYFIIVLINWSTKCPVQNKEGQGALICGIQRFVFQNSFWIINILELISHVALLCSSSWN